MLHSFRSSRTLFVSLCLGAIVQIMSLVAQPVIEDPNGEDRPVNVPQQGERSVTTRLLNPKHSDLALEVRKVAGVNSPARDNTPIISADGSVMFFNSTRLGSRAWASYNPFKGRYDDDIYFAVRSLVRRDEEIWDEPVNLGNTINSSEDDGVVSISPDGQTLYFNSLKKGWEKDGGPFYYARLRGRDWGGITGLGGGISQFFKDRPRGSGFRVYGGSISSDGNDFYFATTLFSPTGKHQIWVSHRRHGVWSYPENLGPSVNDGTGSYAPCISADGKTLFFTSGASEGYGGDDLYVSSYENGVWGPRVNIGAGINTKDHNSFLTIPASGDRIYFSSVQVDGEDEDIFVAPLPEVLRPRNVVLLSGNVLDKATGAPLEAEITIEDLQTGETIFKANSNSLDGGYTTVLRAGRDYGISISAGGYLFLSDRYTIPLNTKYYEYKQDFPLEKLQQGMNFVVNNIFFDYDQATLRPESRPELERMIALMQERPNLLIEVQGHTDNVGSADYNHKLSLRRAEAVRDYIANVGCLDPGRIRVRGFGYTKPLATNRTEQGRQQNRRSEFTVIAM